VFLAPAAAATAAAAGTAGRGRGPTPELAFYASNALGMGLSVSSNFAQRFATAVAQIAMAKFDREEAAIVAVMMAWRA
jgi:hypothetical protein